MWATPKRKTEEKNENFPRISYCIQIILKYFCCFTAETKKIRIKKVKIKIKRNFFITKSFSLDITKSFWQLNDYDVYYYFYFVSLLLFWCFLFQSHSHFCVLFASLYCLFYVRTTVNVCFFVFGFGILFDLVEWKTYANSIMKVFIIMIIAIMRHIPHT